MRKKKIIILFVVVFLGASAFVFLLPGPRPQVIGEISPKELALIRSAIRREIWRGTLSDHSWQGIKQLPATIEWRMGNRVQKIETLPGGVARATITTGKRHQTAQLRPAYYDLFLRNGPKGWEIVSPVGDLGPTSSRGF